MASSVIVVSTELEKKIENAINRGRSNSEISKNSGICREGVRLFRITPTLRSLKKKKNIAKGMSKKLRMPARCPECGSRITEWPCLVCQPASRIHASGLIKPEDEGTVIKNGIQITGHVIIPDKHRIVMLVRIARNLVEMHNEGLLACDGVLLRHLVADAKAALIVDKS